MIILCGIFGVSVSVICVCILSNCTSLKKMYLTEVTSEITKQKAIPHTGTNISEASIMNLPDPVKKHLRVCGYVGQRYSKNVKVTWKNASIRMNRNGPWMKLKCDQFNSVLPEPARIVLMRSKIAGIIPFSGRDKYQNGHGNMYIRLLGLITVGNVTGKNMDHSALVTVLAELFLAPSYTLQEYISWEPIDSISAKARMTFNDCSVSGTFIFNENGEFTQFVTEDRYQKETDTQTVKWSAIATDYVEKKGIRFPTELKAIWHEKDGDFEYFRGKVNDLEFDILKP